MQQLSKMSITGEKDGGLSRSCFCVNWVLIVWYIILCVSPVLQQTYITQLLGVKQQVLLAKKPANLAETSVPGDYCHRDKNRII